MKLKSDKERLEWKKHYDSGIVKLTQEEYNAVKEYFIHKGETEAYQKITENLDKETSAIIARLTLSYTGI